MKINVEGIKLEIPGEGKFTIDNLTVECSPEEFSKNVDAMVEVVNRLIDVYGKEKIKINK